LNNSPGWICNEEDEDDCEWVGDNENWKTKLAAKQAAAAADAELLKQRRWGRFGNTIMSVGTDMKRYSPPRYTPSVNPDS
jgi:hypothetical protein